MGESLSHQKGLLKVLGFVGLCVGFFVLHIHLRTLVVTNGFAVAERREQVRELEAELATLRVQKERLMGPKSLERLAAQFARDGGEFAPPTRAQILYADEKR